MWIKGNAVEPDEWNFFTENSWYLDMFTFSVGLIRFQNYA